MRPLLTLFLLLAAACGGTVTTEGPRHGYRITVHGSADSVAECLKKLSCKEPLEPLDTLFSIRADSAGNMETPTHEGKMELEGVLVDVDVFALNHLTVIEVMSSRPKASGRATSLISEALESCSIAFDPVSLGEIGR